MVDDRRIRYFHGRRGGLGHARVQELANPAPVESPGVAYAVLGIAFVLKEYPLRKQRCKFDVVPGKSQCRRYECSSAAQMPHYVL